MLMRARTRTERLDQYRGIAVLLMVADHVLAIGVAVALLHGTPLSPAAVSRLRLVRLTVTRLALPLFAGVSGYLLADRDGPSSRRRLQLVAAAVVAQVLFAPLPGMSDVDVLVVIVVAQLAWPLVRRRPAEAACAGIVLAFNLPSLPHGWTGYSPMLVLAFMCVGALAADRDRVRRDAPPEPLRLPGWVSAIGRRPLTAYLAHLGVLWVAVHLIDHGGKLS